MAINAFPIQTVLPTASIIGNVPFGIITATDVQAALNQLEAAITPIGDITASQVLNVPAGIISATDVQTALNQLASAIPAPSSGTDPLFLVNGFSLDAFNPAIDGNVSNRYGMIVNQTTTCVHNDPSFSNAAAAQFTMNALHGQGNYNALTQAKVTFFALNSGVTCIGSGQRFVQGNFITAYGMGDVAIYGNQGVVFASGPIDGDEGVGWQLASQLSQQNFRSITNIAAVPTPCAINTTTTQGIAKSQFAQTVNVVSTAGIATGGLFWVVVDQELPTSASNMESVKITGFTATSITGIFRCNHNSGCTIKAALLLQLNSHFTLGQDRFLVNYSQMTYAVGNIASILGGGFNGGGGANWSVGMVGGNALNIGAITLPSDDCTITPYTVVNPNKAIYQIKALVSPTLLAIMSTSVAADASYRGFGPGPTGRGAANQPYVIYPCAKILRIAEGMVICENSTSTWAINDQVEQPICAYPDVTGYLYRMACYSTGGTYRAFMEVRNTGARAFDACLNFPYWEDVVAPGGDGVNWRQLIFADCRVDTILAFTLCRATTTAIGLPSAASGAGFTDQGGAITWSGRSILPNTANQGFDFNVAASSFGAAFTFSGPGTTRNPDPSFPVMSWGGYIEMHYAGGANRPFIQFDRDGSGDAANYTRLRMGYDNGFNFIMETQKLGTGSNSDIVLKTNGVEQLRAIGGSNVQFSNPASFAANGAVATSLTGVGPSGASTTVQKWLKIKDNGGADRYIPCF